RFASDDPDPPQLSPLSLHDALPISPARQPTSPQRFKPARTVPPYGSSTRSTPSISASAASLVTSTDPTTQRVATWWRRRPAASRDRKSTRLNSSHVSISYAVFCLKK